MNIGYAFLVVMVGMAYFVSGVPTPDQMIAEFRAGQRFYTSKAYDQALEKYQEVYNMESRFLDSDKVIEEIGAMRSPIKDLCLYQSGNSYFQMARDENEKALDVSSQVEKDKLMMLSKEYVQSATEYFDLTQERSQNMTLRAQAQNRIVEAWYLVDDYDRVIQEGEELIAKYPNSSYVLEAMYNIGWAHYDKKDYDQAIEAFTSLTERFSTGNLPDRALFQIGESYFDQERYSEAVPYYQQLVDKMRIAEMTDQEIQKMQRQKLSGLVDQTALDIAAQAQLKIGACYAYEKRYKEAETAFKRIAVMFRFDQSLITKAYQDLADMYLDAGDFEASIGAYRDAIDEVPNRIFSANMQTLIAQRYFEYEHYDRAITEFTNYISGYADVAIRAGFEVDRALYYLGRSYFELGASLIAQKEMEAGQDNVAQATATYERLLKQFPDTDLKENVFYNMALAYQENGSPEYLQKAIDMYNHLMTEYPETPNRKFCYFQIAAALYSLNNYDEAIAQYRQIIDEYPNDSSLDHAWFQIARAYKDSERDLETVDPFLNVGRTNNRLYTIARLFAAQTLMEHQRFDEAVDVLKTAVEDTSSIDTIHNLSRFYIMIAGSLRSIADATSDEEKLREAIDYYSQAIDLNVEETYEQASVFRAGVLISLNQYEQAETDLRQLMKSDNEGVRRDAQIRLAMISVRQDKSQQAIETYLGLYESTNDPDEKIEFLRNVIQISAMANDTNSLVRYSNMMLESDLADGKKPDNSQAFYKEEAIYYLADTFEKRGEYQRAIQYYLDGYNMFPDSYFSSDMLLKVGVLYLTRMTNEPGALDTSAEYFEQYIKSFPATPLTELAHYYLGFCYFNGRRFTDASRTFGDFAGKYPNSEFAPEAYHYNAESNYNLGNFDEAVRGFNVVISRFPTHEKAEEALFTRAWALLDLDREEEAIDSLNQIVEKYPNGRFSASALYSVADYYYNIQRYDEALSNYRAVLERYPDSEVAERIPDTIRELTETVAYLEYEKAYTLFSQARETNDLNLYRKAAEGFRLVVDNYPDTESETGAYANMGFAYEELGEFNLAVEAYDQVIKKFEGGGAVSQEAFTFARMHRDYIVANKL